MGWKWDTGPQIGITGAGAQGDLNPKTFLYLGTKGSCGWE